MAVNRNFTVKYDLDEANTVKRALIFYRDDLMKQITKDNINDPHFQEVGQEAGRIDTMLRRDF